MYSKSAVIGLLLCLVTAAVAQQPDNPFKNAKVGDWAEYKMTGGPAEGKTKMTVTAKTDDEVTYEVAATYSFMGKEMTAPVQKQKIDLKKSYDPVVAANMKSKNVKIENIGEGKEKIKVGDKEYETTWVAKKSTSTFGGKMIVIEHKYWFSPEVPLSGLVKMETVAPQVTTTLELVGSGKK